MRKVLLGILVAFASMQVAHAEEWVVEAHYRGSGRAAARREALRARDPRSSKRNVLRVDTTDQGIATLEAEGLTVTIDQAATAKLPCSSRTLPKRHQRGLGLNGIPGYECFRTVEETYQTMDDLASGSSGHRRDRRHRPELAEDAGRKPRLRDARDAHHEFRDARR